MIMKKIYEYAIALASVVFMASACEETIEKPVEPVFPEETVTQTVKAGESVELAFSPNVEWTIEVTGEGSGNMFWLDDDGMKATSISRKQTGDQVVTVVFSETEELDNNRVCEVMLTMGEETRKIAEYTRLALGRTFEIYTGVAGEEGFNKENGALAYSTAVATEGTLATFAGSTLYTLPVKVISNYPWRLSLPTWIDSDVKEGEAGSTELMLTAVLSSAQAHGAEDNLKFFDASSTEVSVDLKVILPAFLDRIETTIQTTFNFNQAGDVQNVGGTYMEDVPAFFELMSTEATAVKVVEWNQKGSYYATGFADWAAVTKTKYDTEAADAVLARYSVEISVTENATYDDRYADVFVIPASKASVAFAEWFDANTGNLKEEYKKYILGRIYQPGLERDYITLSETDGLYEAALAKYTESQWWASDLGTDNQFELVYSHEDSDAVLIFDEPFASYKVFDYDNIEVPETQLESYWLTFIGSASNGKGRVTMDPTKFNNPNAEFPESFIVFYDASGKVLAGISCRHTTKGVSVVTEPIFKVSSGTAELTSVDSSSELYESIYGNYNVSEIYQLYIKGRSAYLEAVSDHAIWDVMKLDPATFGESKSPITLEPASPNLNIYTGNGAEKSEALFILKDQATDGSLVNFAAIYVIYDPDAAIKVESPFKFVNPSLVGGLATLGQYTGNLLEEIVAEHGVMAEKVFELKYLDSSASSVAMLSVPSVPGNEYGNQHNGASWNNYPISQNYWLTAEMNGSNMTVYMSKSGMYDRFVFWSGQGVEWILVCTLSE